MSLRHTFTRKFAPTRSSKCITKVAFPKAVRHSQEQTQMDFLIPDLQNNLDEQYTYTFRLFCLIYKYRSACLLTTVSILETIGHFYSNRL